MSIVKRRHLLTGIALGLARSSTAWSGSRGVLRRSMIAARRIGRLVPSNTALLLCDIQERFRDVIWHFPQVVRVAKLLTEVGKALDMPTLATEQYPKALGPTVPEIPLVQPDYTIERFEKKLFSMCTEELKARLGSLNRKSVLLFGIEAHVCVQQTALDLLEQGYDVHLIVDGVSSQRPHDRAVALRRLEQSGAFITTSESAIFMLTQSADHAKFKAISGLVKEHAKSENPFNAIAGL